MRIIATITYRPIRHHSAIETLPPDLAQEVDTLIPQGQTYRAIAAHLEAQGYTVSKSAVARYGKRLLARVEHIQTMNEMAQALTTQTCSMDLEEAAMQAALTQLLQHLLTPDETLDTQDLLKILNGLARAQSAAVQREQWKAKQRKRIASIIETERKGLSDETINEIKAKILGMPVERFVPDNNEMSSPSGSPEGIVSNGLFFEPSGLTIARFCRM